MNAPFTPPHASFSLPPPIGQAGSTSGAGVNSFRLETGRLPIDFAMPLHPVAHDRGRELFQRMKMEVAKV